MRLWICDTELRFVTAAQRFMRIAEHLCDVNSAQECSIVHWDAGGDWANVFHTIGKSRITVGDMVARLAPIHGELYDIAMYVLDADRYIRIEIIEGQFLRVESDGEVLPLLVLGSNQIEEY